MRSAVAGVVEQLEAMARHQAGCRQAPGYRIDFR